MILKQKSSELENMTRRSNEVQNTHLFVYMKGVSIYNYLKVCLFVIL